MIPRTLSGKNISRLFDYLESQEQYVFLDTSKPDSCNRRSLLFVEPLEQFQYRAGQDRNDFWQNLSARLNDGYYLAGWFGYEFLHDTLLEKTLEQGTLLADLWVYRSAMSFDHHSGVGDVPISGDCQNNDDGNGYILKNLSPSMQEDEYCKAIAAILGYIAAGDTYQVNYTFKFTFDFYGSVPSFYKELRRSQPVPYSCCMKNGSTHIMSFSPELFFRIDAEKIYARPMKGTMKRGRYGEEDNECSLFLQNDIKNRSENVMIVDLLRNDLSRLVEATGGGTVKVASLFDIERYRSVFQMTSSIVACRDRNETITPQEILEAIFPCGSVTGAPKIRTMEIIDELENHPRGVYTGAIGYFSPENGGVFNVPIRTVVLKDGRGEMGIGSGIVADSSPRQEWEECLLKAGFLTNPFGDFKLIETLFYHSPDGCLFLEDHLDRLEASADYYDFSYCARKIRSELEGFCKKLDNSTGHRVRLLLGRDGTLEFSSSPCQPPALLAFPEHDDHFSENVVLIGFSSEQTDSSNPCFFHKTTRRKQYDSALQEGISSGLYDVIFCNEKHEVTEGCISNLFILKDGNYYTPPLRCGLLNGVMRKNLLTAYSGACVSERVLTQKDVQEAEELFICNSVRGIMRARLIDI